MDPFIVLQDTTGITEAGFTGEGDDNRLVRMVRAGIFGIPEFVRITAGEHFVDGIEGIIRNVLSMFGPNRIPVVLKDLADGDVTG